MIAVAGVVGSLLFVASLDEFTSTGARFGVNFDLSMELPSVGAKPVFDRLARDPELAAVGAVRSGVVDVAGRSVDAFSIEPVKGAMSPVVRDGRLPTGVTEVAIGPKLLAALGKHIGDEIPIDDTRRNPALDDRGLGVLADVRELDLQRRGRPHARGTDEVRDQSVRRDRRPDPPRRRPRRRLPPPRCRRFPYGVSDESLPHAPGPVRNLEQITRLPIILALFFALLGAAAFVHALSDDRERSPA